MTPKRNFLAFIGLWAGHSSPYIPTSMSNADYTFKYRRYAQLALLTLALAVTSKWKNQGMYLLFKLDNQIAQLPELLIEPKNVDTGFLHDYLRYKCCMPRMAAVRLLKR